MTYCKTLDPADYGRIYETAHVVKIKDLLEGAIFQHPHRAWEYGIVLQALSAHKCESVLDVGGGLSVFGPAAAAIAMRVVIVDPGDYAEWTRTQASRIGRPIEYEKQDFMRYKGEELFDAVTCLSVLEHVPDDIKFFKKLIQFVKPGGLLALTVDFWPDGKPRLDGHLRTYNEKRLLKLIKTARDFEPLGELDYGQVEMFVNNYTFASLILKRDDD
jgi:ubiquinone/menaquinone biosynthesis C-methylase UbiE